MTGHADQDCLTIIRAIHTAVPPVITEERAGPQCKVCPWRQGDQPCVWPRGMCDIGKKVRIQ